MSIRGTLALTYLHLTTRSTPCVYFTEPKHFFQLLTILQLHYKSIIQVWLDLLNIGADISQPPTFSSDAPWILQHLEPILHLPGL
jgi:hypothetical protein